jgi:riboflavin synthase
LSRTLVVVFTGIVEEIASVRSVDRGPAGVRLCFTSTVVTAELRPGDSIAVNGCCLTVVDCGDTWWAADVVPETLSRTSLGRLRPGETVNLERSLSANARLGGHLVQGHVDSVGRVVVKPPPLLEVEVPDHLRRYIVVKGSIAVDGVSLTVAELTEAGFIAAIVPHTLEATTLGMRMPGDPVNLEVDVVAKYVEKLAAAYIGAVSA